MLLSIIIPVYNAELFLKKCVDSLILSKKDYPVEILLINDGSLDNSLQICLDYEAMFDYIKVINQKNSGPSAARNAGLNFANGDYICFVDSDDNVKDVYFDLIFKNTHQKFDVVIFGFNKINGNDIGPNKFNGKLLQRQDILQLIRFSSINMCLFWFPWNKVYKSTLLKGLRFNNKIKIGEDTVFNVEAFVRAEKIKIIENCLYNYINNENSLTQIKYKENLLENMNAHFDNRIAIHKKYDDINSSLYYEDVAKYYTNHILFWLLGNLYNSPNKGNILYELGEIRASRIYEFSLPKYKNNFKFVKKNILILLFNFRFLKIINLYFKNA